MSILMGCYRADKEVETIWEEFDNVLFDEDEDGDLILAEDWREWHKGVDRETIWKWFDKHHSKGVYYLLYDYEYRRRKSK